MALVGAFTNEQIKIIYANISNGTGRHGSFLKAFAVAIFHADIDNFEILKQSAIRLIEKYNLVQPKYLKEY